MPIIKNSHEKLSSGEFNHAEKVCTKKGMKTSLLTTHFINLGVIVGGFGGAFWEVCH